ncbi:exonuclease domain-containing protein [Paracoccus rhizosphaerae]|uniref:DNA-directed DNA polymerase n=1 Tax=Paracoccus rhizosphaerae TaxID=1133347 RepID=A0ABV6CM12_9RHOB|nr:exonuclease domain-containing protein [Paracoccus rhizosphaerae]
MTTLSLRQRILAMFSGLLALSLVVVGLALWRAGQGGVDALVQAAMLAGFGLAGLVTGLWFLFDRNLARPVETLAGALRTGQAPGPAEAAYLADLGAAAADAARARERSDDALRQAARDHAAEVAREKANLEAILADIGAGAVLTDAEGRVVFYNASAARSLPGLGLDRMLDRHLNADALRAARDRLAAGAQATDLTCASAGGERLSARLRRVDGGQLLILRDHRPPSVPRDAVEALRRHAATLVPMLEVLDGPIPPALARAIRAEGRGLATATRRLSDAVSGPEGAAADVRELVAGLQTTTPLPDLCFRAEAAPLNALLQALDARLRAQGLLAAVGVQPDLPGQMRVALEWQGAPVAVDTLDDWLEDAPDPGQPEISGAEILAAHDTGIWPEAEGGTARLVIPLWLAEARSGDSGVTYDFGLPARRLGSTRLSDLTCVVFDTETTGLEPSDRIVQIAGLRLVRGRRTGERFETLVDPGRPIPPASTKIHGIDDAAVSGAPTLSQALMAFHHFCDDAVLIAHNAPFDMGFLRRAQPETGLQFDNRVLDTVLLSAMIWGQSAVHSLDALSERLGIVIPPEARHTAMGDTIATAEAFLRLIPALAAKGIVTFEDAVAEGRRHRRLIGDANLPG